MVNNWIPKTLVITFHRNACLGANGCTGITTHAIFFVGDCNHEPLQSLYNSYKSTEVKTNSRSRLLVTFLSHINCLLIVFSISLAINPKQYMREANGILKFV